MTSMGWVPSVCAQSIKYYLGIESVVLTLVFFIIGCELNQYINLMCCNI